MRILVLFAHPARRRSRVNAAMAEAAARVPGVTVHDLYETYPNLVLDIDHEQDRLRRHDAIVFQHPIYWYSCPAILKEWQDLVLEHGFAYGRGGTALAGKALLSAVTTGGGPEAYGPEGMHGHPLADFLRPFEATARLCGMRWLEPFIVHDAHLVEPPDIARLAAAYAARLAALSSPPPVMER